jgi:hypothetical protein
VFSLDGITVASGTATVDDNAYDHRWPSYSQLTEAALETLKGAVARADAAEKAATTAQRAAELRRLDDAWMAQSLLRGVLAAWRVE